MIQVKKYANIDANTVQKNSMYCIELNTTKCVDQHSGLIYHNFESSTTKSSC